MGVVEEPSPLVGGIAFSHFPIIFIMWVDLLGVRGFVVVVVVVIVVGREGDAVVFTFSSSPDSLWRQKCAAFVGVEVVVVLSFSVSFSFS